MPFKSEAQRKYLWANEPEIARDWTDEYGSGIQAAQGGRIGFYRGSPHSSGRGPGPGGQSSAGNRGRDPGPGPGGQSGDRGGSLSTGSPHSGSWSGPTYSKPDTVTFDTGPNIHREGIGSQTFNKNLRNLQRQQQYQQGAYQRAHPFLSKVRSGLGSLGRGMKQVGRNINPLSFAADNPLMKLLASGYGQGNTRNLFQRNNQNINWNDPDQEEDIAWENVNYNPNALTRLQMEQDIPEDSPTDSLMDERTLMAFAPGSTKDTRLKTLHNQVTEGLFMNDADKKEYEQLRKEDAEQTIEPKTILSAEGGLIGSVGGTSRQKYQEGNMVEGEMGAEMEGAMMQSQEVIKELYDALIAQGLSPQEAMEKIKQIIASTQTQEPQSPMMGEEFPGQEFGGGPRAPAAFGGIMDTYTGRRKYGLGSFIKKAFKKVKKLASSKLGKLALMYAAGTYLGGTQALGGTGWGSAAGQTPWKKFGAQLLSPTSKQGIGNVFRPSGWNMFQKAPNVLSTAASENIGSASKVKELMDAKALSLNEKAFLEAMQPKSFIDKIPGGITTAIAVPSLIAGATVDQQQPEEFGELDTEYDTKKADMDRYLANLGTYEGGDYRVPEKYRVAQGGRIGRQEGGLMDLGGMEKDYRDDGGFVPLGGEEKADDVPARLSKNEFVFTADAVRNAGGGDIDRGAEVMENVMKNLEAGGQVSEESQGQGAEEMFEVSERLSEVV